MYDPELGNVSKKICGTCKARLYKMKTGGGDGDRQAWHARVMQVCTMRVSLEHS